MPISSEVSTAESEFLAWSHAAQAQLKVLGGEVTTRYTDSSSLKHYYAVAQRLFKLEDYALAQAGFLHGVRDHDQLNKLTGVAEGVRSVLEGHKQLRSYAADDRDVPRQLATEVLPLLGDPRAAVLLVVEQLDHFDPDDSFAAFLRRFHFGSVEAPQPRQEIAPTSFKSFADQILYLKKVVATAAQYLGLWFEHNLCEDLGLFHTDMEHFRKIVRFTADAHSNAQLLSRTIQSELPAFPDAVHWEWHHVESINRRLLQFASTSWLHHLPLCGMVTVECKKPAQCYEALGALHCSSRFEHQSLELEDRINVADLSGYEAFHTIVKPKDSQPLRLRILPADSAERRFEGITQNRLSRIKELLSKRGKKGLSVFAHDGRAVSLPPLSTVLNFCLAIHSDLLALAESATVNRDLVSLVHPLSDGDVVRINSGKLPRPLPEGWEDHVAPKTARRIRQAHAHAFRPKQIQQGRKLFQSLLAEHGVRIELDETSLDSFLDEAIWATKPDWRGAPSPSLRWLRMLRDVDRPSDNRPITALVEEVARRIRRSKDLLRESIDIPESLSTTHSEVRACPRCQPTAGSQVTGVVEGSAVVIHRAQATCGSGGQRLEWTRDFSRGQYFVVGMKDGPGVAAKILTAISRPSVDIFDIAGSKIGPRNAALRVGIRSIPSRVVEEVYRDLRSIPEIYRVVDPFSDTIVPALEGALAPRGQLASPVTSDVSPYVYGRPITEDSQFYGRSSELITLRAIYQRAREDTQSVANGVFLTGPKRFGKTSLALQFLRELDRREYLCTTIRENYHNHVSWPTLKRSLYGQLREAAEEIIIQDNPSGGGKALPQDVFDLLEWFRQIAKRTVVIFIDEIIRLLHDVDRGDDAREVAGFLYRLTSTPRVLTILAGPENHSLTLTNRLGHIIRGVARPIAIRPLDEPSFRDLLIAQKTSSLGSRITLSTKQSKEICRYLGGNPYWANWFADIMYRHARGATSQVKLSARHVEAARRELIGTTDAFLDRRVEDFPAPEFAVAARTILETIVHKGPSTASDLFARARRRDENLASQAFDRILHMWVAQGSIKVDEQNPTAWAIAAPVLEDHLRQFWPQDMDCNETRPHQ